jgi:hypothetical protein
MDAWPATFRGKPFDADDPVHLHVLYGYTCVRPRMAAYVAEVAHTLEALGVYSVNLGAPSRPYRLNCVNCGAPHEGEHACGWCLTRY